MSKLNQVKEKIQRIEPGIFQNLMNAYLKEKFKTDNIHYTGSQTATDRTTKGTPDAYIRNKDKSITMIEYTLESILYGGASSVMLVSMVVWFYSFSDIMTSDKFVYLFGKIMPSLSLILSMALGFVPKFIQKIKEVSNTQKTLGKDVSTGSIFKRIQHSLVILSIVISWVLEDGIETSDSMKARGYGLKNRTSFSIYTISTHDKHALIYIISLSAVIFYGAFKSVLSFAYFPMIKGNRVDLFSIMIWILYALLLMMPLMINKKEEFLWKRSALKI